MTFFFHGLRWSTAHPKKHFATFTLPRRLAFFRVRLKKEIGGVLAESDGQINAQNT